MMEDSDSLENIAFLGDLHLCKKKNENGNWVSCITSQYKYRTLVLMTETASPDVIYVKYCPFCGKEK